jgi:hypothetical protein
MVNSQRPDTDCFSESICDCLELCRPCGIVRNYFDFHLSSSWDRSALIARTKATLLAFEPGLDGLGELRVARNSQLAAHDCLHFIQFAADQTEEIRELERESDVGGFLVAFRNVPFSIRDIELVRMAAVGRDDLELDIRALWLPAAPGSNAAALPLKMSTRTLSTP